MDATPIEFAVICVYALVQCTDHLLTVFLKYPTTSMAFCQINMHISRTLEQGL